VSLELQSSNLIVPATVALCMQVFRAFFNESKGYRESIKLQAGELKHQLISDMVNDMEDDVDKAYKLDNPSDALRDSFYVRRRGNTAQKITLNIWELAKNQTNIENSFKSWSRWEGNGRATSLVGTIVSCSMFLILLILIAINPTRIVISNIYLWLVVLVFGILLIWIIICCIAAKSCKRKYMKLQDEK
jgi:Flp pilus assembly protein TadB